MKTLVVGILLGIGIGWLIAPMPGDKTRRLLGTRWQELNTSLAENGWTGPWYQRASIALSQTRGNIVDLLQSRIGSSMKGNEGTFLALAQVMTETVTKATKNGNLSQNVADLVQLIASAGKR